MSEIPNRSVSGVTQINEAEFTYIKELVYRMTGIVLADHKKVMVQSRLNIRLRSNNMSSYKEYVHELKNNKKFADQELPELVNRITTNKTDFFRENHHFIFLKEKYFPAFEKHCMKTGKKKLRIWCAAASTGEEPYTIAMTANEYFGSKPGWDIKIYASDIDTNVLRIASDGVYKEERLGPVSDTLRKKYFTTSHEKGTTMYHVKPELKSKISYKKLNLLEFPYVLPEKVDIIFCRNVIIYFDKPTQRKIFDEFENHLTDEGFLIIGHSETMFGISDHYKFLGHTIYQKKTADEKDSDMKFSRSTGI